MKSFSLFLFVILVSAFGVEAQTDNFWNSLKNTCGKAFAGEIVHAPENDSFRGKKLVMHVRSCEENVIKIPFFVGEDKSRTWVLTKVGDRIQLKHDHRHKDGKPDEVTMYGGTASNSGSAGRQVFPADEETQKMLPAAASNVWWIDLTKESYTYNLRRVGTERFFSIKFDLTKEVEKPEAPWGWDRNVPRRITYNEKQDRYPSFSPVREKIMFESDRSGVWGIYELNVDGTDTKLLSDANINSRYPSYAPNYGVTVFSMTSEGKSGIGIIMGYDSVLNLGLTYSDEILFPVFSPINKRIAFSAGSDLFVLDSVALDTLGKTARKIASTKFREAWLRWSPDEKKVAFFSRRDTNDEDDEIYVMDYPNGAPKRITNRKGHDFCPSWSPDGKRLAVAAIDEKLGRSINIIDLEGKILSRHGLGFERVTEPNWSPDGKQLIYTARKDGNYDIYTERID